MYIKWFVLVVDGDGVGRRENEIVRARERETGWDAGAEECAGVGLEFEEFGGAGIDLLMDGGGEADGIGRRRRIFSERDSFGAQRKENGAVWL